MSEPQQSFRLVFTNQNIRDVPINVSSEIIDQIKSVLKYSIDASGKYDIDRKSIPAAYSIIYKYLESISQNISDSSTSMWFSQAYFINAGDGLASEFLRSYTAYAAQKDGINIPVDKMQDVSNAIGYNVLGYIISTSQIPTMAKLLEQEITSAIGLPSDPVTHIVDYSRWGGSFYYWNVPALTTEGNPVNKTIGEVIMADPVMKARFVDNLGYTLADVGSSAGLDKILYGHDVETVDKLKGIFFPPVWSIL